MSKLNSLMGKAKKFKVGEIELELKPRTLKDINLIMDLSIEEKRGEAMKELIRSTLKDAVPDATDEEIDNVAFEYFQVLSESIIEVNGLKNEQTG